MDTNWYIDSGATDHITGEFDKVSVRERYHGQDQVQALNGSGMMIRHIGQPVIPTLDRDLHLKNILHVPDAHKNLISIHCLANDNRAFLEFYHDFFNIKDRATKKVIHTASVKASSTPWWHHRINKPLESLGHLLRDGTVAYLMHRFLLFIVSLRIISCVTLHIPMIKLFVIHVSVPKVINYHIQNHPMFLLCPLLLFSQMFAALLPHQLADMIIILAS